MVKQALSVLDFHDEKCQVHKAVAMVSSYYGDHFVQFIGHSLGNLTCISGGTEENSKLSNTNDASNLAKVSVLSYHHYSDLQLLQCSNDIQEKSLTHRTIEAHGERLLTPLSVEQATYAHDALAKSTYERMFHWLVKRLNCNSSLENKVCTSCDNIRWDLSYTLNHSIKDKLCGPYRTMPWLKSVDHLGQGSCYIHSGQHICDRLSENPHSLHLMVIREILIQGIEYNITSFSSH